MGKLIPPMYHADTELSSHYDVISAPQKGWDSNPFVMSGRNGYLYGRGVTDDKGPIIATACAAADLLTKRALGADLVFLIEGEEECGSTGFRNAVQANKDAIGHIDAILVRQVYVDVQQPWRLKLLKQLDLDHR